MKVIFQVWGDSYFIQWREATSTFYLGMMFLNYCKHGVGIEVSYAAKKYEA